LIDPDRDLPCQDLVELVTDYLEGRLTPMEQRRFEAHLALCRGCRTYLEQMRQTVRALGKLSDESIDPEARERLLAVFRAWRRGAA
jgi:anti-sigma factor RsiW